MASFSNDSRILKIKKPLPKPQILRDYLLDDMSSCSSNGFRSYPRRQCCTTVRFLVESDLKKKNKQHRTLNIKPKQSSLLQKASTAMIHVFKRLPFAGISRNVNLLPRSLSRKILKRNLWKNNDQMNNNCANNIEVKLLKSFGDLLKENENEITTSPSRVSTVVTAATITELTRSTSDSNMFTTGNCLEVVLGQKDVTDEIVDKKMMMNEMRVDTTTATTTTTTTVTDYSDSAGDTKIWQDKHDEQFSPVSVMDFPTDNDDDVDEDDEVSSGLSRGHLDDKGTKLSKRKTRVSDRVPQLEPVKLEDRIAQLVLESPTTTYVDFVHKENQIEKKATALLQLMKSMVFSHRSLKYEVVETVLLGFFKESALEENVSDYEMLQRAKDWMDGQEQDIFLDWECNNNRERYLRDMEKGVDWSNYGHQLEKVNVGLEVECEVFDSLVNDVLIEFCLQAIDNEDYDF